VSYTELMEGFARRSVAFLAIAACAAAASACGSGKPLAHARSAAPRFNAHWVSARIEPLPTHRVVLSRSWTPAVLAEITNRIDPHRGISVRAVYRDHVPDGNPKGWWFVWNDPTRNSQAEGMQDYWAAQVAGRLYQARRVLSAPKLSGIQVKTRVPSTDSDWAAGENSRWWPGHTPVYVEARPAALRTGIRRRAAVLGLELSSFRAPRLDGIVAPVVTLRVRDEARFKRWYVPGCAEGWLFGPRASTNGSPYFGFFVTFDDSAGRWLMSMAATPNEGTSQKSPEMQKLFPPPHLAPGQIGDIATCPKRFARA